MDKQRQKAIKFFAENAGYSVPPGRMACAKALADAEQYANDQEWCFSWEGDNEGCSGCDCGDASCACSAGTEHETLACVLKDVEGNVLASLSGICSPSPQYSRVVEAELADEALHNERTLNRICVA